MTDQLPEEFSDAPDGEFVDLTAVDLVVATTLYGEDCDELTTFALTAGVDPFIMLSMSQKAGENTLVYELLGSLINTEADLLLSVEAFGAALRAKLEAEGEVKACSCGGRDLDVDCTPECDLNG